jgi:hypothetical protein
MLMVRFALVLSAVALATALAAQTPSYPPCVAQAQPSGLPLPSTYAKNQDPSAYQKVLFDFLQNWKYVDKKWCVDKGFRDTGPWIQNQALPAGQGSYYGTHPAVRIYYSPEVMEWLIGGRKGELKDGAMMIKEQMAGPAERYAGKSDKELRGIFAKFPDWTIMIKDKSGSADGWYWTELWGDPAAAPPTFTYDSYQPPFAVFNSGFGLYCVRCHAAGANELTFASLVNIEGFPGTPLTFRVDDSWRCADNPLCIGYQPATPPPSLADESPTRKDVAPNHPAVDPDPVAAPTTSLESISKFFTVQLAKLTDPIPTMPGENYDHVVSQKGQHMLTSDQCMSCHDAGTYGNIMYIQNPHPANKDLQTINVSPYGEWRWSPMGLAGRDPIFYAQLESEIAYLQSRKDPDLPAIVNLCFSCHGVMGERQLQVDSKGKDLFRLDFTQITQLKDPHFKYAALARDGVSCAACHHIASTANETFSQFIHKNITGQFTLGPPDELRGPFKDDDIVQFPMDEALAKTPKYDEYFKSSRLCGSCHTIKLPVLDETPVGHSFEQLTYLEWVNSEFENEFDKKNPKAKSCQDCHMKGTYDGHQIKTKFANTEDESYPMVDERAPGEKINLRFREKDYARHQLQGLNVFLLEFFDQFPQVLGVRKCDYMISCGNPGFSDIPAAKDNFIKQARLETATVALSTPTVKNNKLTADVTVANLTGHRFPSGVSFRRAFLEFTVTDKSGKLLFGSGRTNGDGWIIDDKGNILPSEYNGAKGEKGKYWQPHFYAPSKPITRSDQVQIYEELLKDAQGNFTTSFIRQDDHFKDNRLLPRGWTKNGPNPKEFNGRALEATHPHNVGDDPRYKDGSGTSVVRYEVTLPAGTTAKDVKVSAKLYYQAIPGYYLNQRFEQVPNGTNTIRLYQLVTQLKTEGTPFPDWKLFINGASWPN